MADELNDYEPTVTPYVTTDEEAIQALEDFGAWLSKIPADWNQLPIAIGDAATTRPEKGTIPAYGEAAQIVILWPPENYQRAEDAWRFLATEYTSLEAFPFLIYGDPPTSAKFASPLVAKFNSFVSWAKARAGLVVPALPELPLPGTPSTPGGTPGTLPTTPAKPKPPKPTWWEDNWWKVVTGLSVGVVIIGIGYLLLRDKPPTTKPVYSRRRNMEGW